MASTVRFWGTESSIKLWERARGSFEAKKRNCKSDVKVDGFRENFVFSDADFIKMSALALPYNQKTKLTSI